MYIEHFNLNNFSLLALFVIQIEPISMYFKSILMPTWLQIHNVPKLQQTYRCFMVFLCRLWNLATFRWSKTRITLITFQIWSILPPNKIIPEMTISGARYSLHVERIIYFYTLMYNNIHTIANRSDAKPAELPGRCFFLVFRAVDWAVLCRCSWNCAVSLYFQDDLNWKEYTVIACKMGTYIVTYIAVVGFRQSWNSNFLAGDDQKQSGGGEWHGEQHLTWRTSKNIPKPRWCYTSNGSECGFSTQKSGVCLALYLFWTWPLPPDVV